MFQRTCYIIQVMGVTVPEGNADILSGRAKKGNPEARRVMIVKRISFTKQENRILPNFRQKINMAESTEDVKKFFLQAARDLFEEISGKRIAVEYGDITLLPEMEPHFTMSDRFSSLVDLNDLWSDSDLPRVMNRFAVIAARRYCYLEKHPEKTDAKIRM